MITAGLVLVLLALCMGFMAWGNLLVRAAHEDDTRAGWACLLAFLVHLLAMAVTGVLVGWVNRSGT